MGYMHLNDGRACVYNRAVLRTEFVGLLRRMATSHGQQKARCVFLTNNYDQIVRTLEEVRDHDNNTTPVCGQCM